MKEYIISALKGIFIGGAMLVPGVSGGTMAIVFGIYDKMIQSVNDLTRRKFKGLPFLIATGLGGVIGIFIFSRPIDYLMNHFPIPTLYFFIGAILGGIPLMARKAQMKKANPKAIIYILLGIAIVFVLHFSMKENLVLLSPSMGFNYYLILFAVGIFMAIALVLPGISGSMMLLMLGLYQPTFDAIKAFDLRFILPLGLGIAIGILTTTQVLEHAMKKYPRGTYCIILGFLIGSIVEVFPLTMPSVPVLLLSIVLMVVAFFAIYSLSKFEQKNEAV